jgi:hypothetical protein
LEKVEQPAEEEMHARVLREWHRIEYVKREFRLMVYIGEVTLIKPVLFEEGEDVAEEMGQHDKGN